MDAFVTIIQTVGFPIFVAVYLLHRHEKKLDKLWQEHRQTNVVLAVLVKVLTQDGAAVPDSVVDEVSGVTSMPTPPSSRGG